MTVRSDIIGYINSIIKAIVDKTLLLGTFLPPPLHLSLVGFILINQHQRLESLQWIGTVSTFNIFTCIQLTSFCGNVMVLIKGMTGALMIKTDVDDDGGEYD